MAPKRTKPVSEFDNVDPRAVEAEFLTSVHNGNVSPAPSPVVHTPTVLAPMIDELKDVRDFAQRIGYLIHEVPTHLTPHLILEQFAMVREAVDTLWDAQETNELEMLAQGLLEIVYAAKLVATALGLPWEALWDEYHLANMEKKTGTGKEGQRVSAVSPPGWEPPALEELLRTAGYDRKRWFDREGNLRTELCADYGQAPLYDVPKARRAARR